MSHCIEYVEFPKGASEKQMLRYADEFAAYNTDPLENPDGEYHGNFMKVSGIAKNREDAEKRLESRGDYEDGYIEFYSDAEPTMRYKELTEQINRKADSLAEYVVKHSVKNRKAKYTACPKCGSKINIEVWKGGISQEKRDFTFYRYTAASPNDRFYYSGKSEKCPICDGNLLPESTQAEIERRMDKIDELKERRDSLTRGKGKIKILAKYEVHC